MSHVYVIQAEGGPVKIGVATDPNRRLAALRTGTPFPLSIAHVEPITNELRAIAVERATHALLSTAKAHGEWFTVSVEEARQAIRKAIIGLGFQPAATAYLPSTDPAVHSVLLTTGNQLKAARALIGLDQAKLAEATALNVNTIRNMEGSGSGPIGGRAVNVQAVQRALETAGVEFLNGDKPGVRLARKVE